MGAIGRYVRRELAYRAWSSEVQKSIVKFFVTGTALLVVASLVGGCAGLLRFAPPGLIKVVDLEGDQPPNPVIESAVAESRERRAGRFPNLSQQPRVIPAKAPLGEREALSAALIGARDDLSAAVSEDREAAALERSEALYPSRDALAAEVDAETAAAARERRTPPKIVPPSE